MLISNPLVVKISVPELIQSNVYNVIYSFILNIVYSIEKKKDMRFTKISSNAFRRTTPFCRKVKQFIID